MPTEKSESKPDTTEDPETTEEHPQDALRREGLRLNPQWQTEHLDTTGGGPVDMHRVSPVFEEARQHAVRQLAKAADEDIPPDNVVFAEDADVADRQRELARKLAKDVPDEEPDRRPPGVYSDGMGGPYGQGVLVGDDGTQVSAETDDPGASETSKPVAAPATKATAGDGDDGGEEKDASKSGSSSSTAARKTPAKPASSSSTTTKK
jgi:hypothetical protein